MNYNLNYMLFLTFSSNTITLNCFLAINTNAEGSDCGRASKLCLLVDVVRFLR